MKCRGGEFSTGTTGNFQLELTDLFSLNLSRGFELVRKRDFGMVKITRQGSFVRVPMSPLSYIQREGIAIKELASLPKQMEKPLKQGEQANEDS